MNFVLAMVMTVALPGVPQSGATAEAFVPKGWTIEAQLDGGLVTPTSKDKVLVLLADEGQGDRARALVVLKGEKSGFSLLGSNVGLLACHGCMGVKGGDGAPELSIEKRVLVISQYGGSREYYGSIHRLRVEKDGLRVIGIDHSSGDSLTLQSSVVSENLLTGAVVEELQPPTPENGPEPKPQKKKSKRAVKPLPKLEDLKEYGG
jgi:hypothetical protein